MKHNKLVRDKIPEIIERSGDRAVIHIAGVDEYEQKLREKLKEEIEEFLKEPNEEELADVLEVLDAIAGLYKLSKDKSQEIQGEKAEKRGRFKRRIILDEARRV